MADVAPVLHAIEVDGARRDRLDGSGRYEVHPDPLRPEVASEVPRGGLQGFSKFEDVWDEKAPLGWNVKDSSAVASSCVAMLSDWFPMTTGEIIHVDGGYHAMGA